MEHYKLSQLIGRVEGRYALRTEEGHANRQVGALFDLVCYDGISNNYELAYMVAKLQPDGSFALQSDRVHLSQANSAYEAPKFHHLYVVLRDFVNDHQEELRAKLVPLLKRYTEERREYLKEANLPPP